MGVLVNTGPFSGATLVRLDKEARVVRLLVVTMLKLPILGLPVNTGPFRGAKLVRLSVVIILRVPILGVPVNTGLAKGAKPDTLGRSVFRA